MKATGKMWRVMKVGSKPQSRYKSPFTKQCCTQGQKSLTRESCIIENWFQSLGRKSCDLPLTLTSILSHIRCFGNRMNIPNQLESMGSFTPQRHSSMLTASFKGLSESQDVIFSAL